MVHIAAHTQYSFRCSFHHQQQLSFIRLLIHTQHPLVRTIKRNQEFSRTAFPGLKNRTNRLQELNNA